MDSDYVDRDIAGPPVALDDCVAPALHATTAFAVTDPNSPAGQRAFRLGPLPATNLALNDKLIEEARRLGITRPKVRSLRHWPSTSGGANSRASCVDRSAINLLICLVAYRRGWQIFTTDGVLAGMRACWE
jgi:hypothetical protein